MKFYLFTTILFLITTPIFGQVSSETNQASANSRDNFNFPIVQNEVDEFEGSTKLLVSRMENWVYDKVNENGLGFDIALGSIDDLYLLYYYGAHSCLKQGESKISLLLENGEVVELGYYGDIDCKSTVRKARFIFVSPTHLNSSLSIDDLVDLQEPNIEKILSSPVKKVRIYTTEGYSEYQTYDVKSYLENIRKWRENNINEAKDNFEKNFAKEQYSEFNEKYQSGEMGAIYYKIPYDNYTSLDMEDMESYNRIYLKTTLESYDESTDLKSYYGYFRGNTKYALMDMIRVLQNEDQK